MSKEKNLSRYIVGIDLGTTHTVAAYADLNEPQPTPKLFNIEQLVAPGEVAARPLLPSLRYHPAAGELAERDLHLPWQLNYIDPQEPRAVFGELARELGSRVPGRLVASAKSWLSYAAVDRMAPILPWGGAEGIDKISPVHASASYLAYVRSAWNHQFPEHPLEKQEVVITIPASFDEGARALTVEAAHLAGLTSARLVEEPQAACYDWLACHEQELNTLLVDTRLILVCDVGGGTTDLTLIKVTLKNGQAQLTRIGVGNHLMLGGDNMDLALAHVAEGQLVTPGVPLSAASLSQLMQQCRNAKERLLSAEAPEKIMVTILGTGAKLIGGARSTELNREAVHHMLLDGFLPITSLDELPQRTRGGIVEFGLPYVSDPAISRHIAAFLILHAQASREALGELAPLDDSIPIPDAILLNGGIFNSALLSQRLLDILAQWRGAPLQQLLNTHPDLAVARGAVAYVMARHGKGIRIGGGSARSYFIQVAAEQEAQQAVCILPRGTEEDQPIRLTERNFALRIGEPVRFHLVSSISDTTFNPGDIVTLDDIKFTPLPPIATVLTQDKDATRLQTAEVPVQLQTTLTEVGTLEMACVAQDKPSQRWKLEFQLRGGKGGLVSNMPSTLHPRFPEAAELLGLVYGPPSKKISPKTIKTLRFDLEKILGKRDDWDTPLLRELFGTLWECGQRRRYSAAHERLWFNLIGFCLRPGFGYPLDDWRVQQLWSIYEQGLQYTTEAAVWAEWWTLWRRVSGGLSESAQCQILDDIVYDLQPSRRTQKRPPGAKPQGYDDMVRLVAALERLPAERKIEVGGWLLERLQKASESQQTWWAIGRIGARVPFYGSVHNVVPAEIAANWLQMVIELDWKKIQPAAFAATMLARMSGDRERDIPPELRAQIIQYLQKVKCPESWIEMVKHPTELQEADERSMYGESLPPGLRLVH
ncbi:Hsp70 family protein [Nitrosomonas sp. Is37]|uniref:Hsp70 family protein n=1 Tax=Nitrosomonas sp. Is37 TaxID=3080535 RepID=UPI00294B7250|nr:Hsp70 family protein [Nitrosomonas sp. Is37]MDV6343474.1 Hsp70 family protein [Nitrosomonas sp. Is37]